MSQSDHNPVIQSPAVVQRGINLIPRSPASGTFQLRSPASMSPSQMRTAQSRSPSPHRRRAPLRSTSSFHSVRSRTSSRGSGRSSCPGLRLLLPLIVFGAVFWIGLQGNSSGSGSHAPRVDPTTLVQQRASWKVGNYPNSNRLRGASPRSENGSSNNKAWDLTVPKVDMTTVVGGGNPQVPPPAQVKGEGEKTWDVAIPKIDTTVGGGKTFPPALAAPRAPKGEGEKSWEVAIPKLDTTMGGGNKLPPPPVVVTQPPIKGEGEKTWEVAIPKVEALPPGAVDEGQAPPRLVVADEPLINVPHSETPPPSELKVTEAPELKATDAPELVPSSESHTRALQKAEDSNIKVVSLYLESRTSLDVSTQPLPVRQTSAENLRRLNFENLTTCTDLPQTLPVDDFPDDDPWLPWIHTVLV